MYHLIYTSHATKALYQDELIALLKECRIFNERAKITGMLLHLNGKFIQVLEGKKGAVLDLFARINLDPRHRRVTKIMEGTSASRIFKDWTMGFKMLSDKEFKDITGFRDIDIFFHDQGIEQKGNLLMTFLTLFYNKNIADYAELPN
jgi:hypothetical protein